MKKFLKIALELGWEQVEEGVIVFKKEDKEGCVNINFVTQGSYDNFDLSDERIDINFVNNYICKVGCCNKVNKTNLKWAIPLLISDYYGHRQNKAEEIVWAKKAIKVKPDLFPKAFPKYLADRL